MGPPTAGKRRLMPWKDDPRSWYQLEVWRRRRRRHLTAHPVCVMCTSKGRVAAATIADHITPHNGNWMAFLHAPIQSLCKACHDSDKRLIDLHGFGKIPIGPDGWPVDGDGRNYRIVKSKHPGGGGTQEPW